MVALTELQTALSTSPMSEYECQENLNLYDSPALGSLATQAVSGRQLCILSFPLDGNEAVKLTAVQVCLCEDDYPGWVAVEDLDLLTLAEEPYRAIALSEREIRDRIPSVIAYTHTAMSQSNRYLWGGTVGPNYDCSGLTQSAFASAGIWLPRDAYQQEAFAQPVSLEVLEPGDLIFFGVAERATHVGVHLGNQDYIHSSGKDQGRNGIGIDRLSAQGDPISQVYYRQFRSAGRVVACYSNR